PAVRDEPYEHGATVMKRKPQVCLEIESDLVAAATGDAEPGAARRVEHHIGACAACRVEFGRYREIDGVVGALRRAPAAADRVPLEWPLDLRLARSDFHRAVLQATAAIPYGAVTSYAGIATHVGNRSAVRAVAQALRWNPLPIVVPCHRVIGSSGSLTGYAGDKLPLKQQLLGVEGVPILRARRDFHVARDTMYVRDHDGREYCLPTCGSLA